MKRLSLITGKNTGKKNLINSSSAEFAQKVIKVTVYTHILTVVKQ